MPFAARVELYWRSLLAVVMAFAAAPLFSAEWSDEALTSLLGRYEDSRGGLLKLGGLEAVRVEGVTRQQGRVYSFVLHRKRPDLLRFRIELGEEALILGYDGQFAWKRSISQTGRETETLGREEADWLSREASLRDPLARALEGLSRSMRYLGLRESMERSVHVIEVVGPFGKRYVYHLDSSSLDVVRRETFAPSGEPVMETLYSDYREVEGYRFAFFIENRVAGQAISLTRIDSVKINPGVLSFYFKRPV
jgi:hypothetical protein